MGLSQLPLYIVDLWICNIFLKLKDMGEIDPIESFRYIAIPRQILWVKVVVHVSSRLSKVVSGLLGMFFVLCDGFMFWDLDFMLSYGFLGMSRAAPPSLFTMGLG